MRSSESPPARKYELAFKRTKPVYRRISVSIDFESPLRARMTSWRSSSSRSARWAGVIRVAGLAAMCAFEAWPTARTDQLQAQLDQEGSRIRQILQGSCIGPFRPGPLRWSLLDRTPTHSFQPCSCLFVDALADPARLLFAVLDRSQGRGELLRADLRHFLSGGAANSRVRRD